ADVNECMRLPYVCDKNAECVNKEGSFICQCLSGFAGNGYNCTKTKTACLDKFDVSYQQTCGRENWREHYYFDHEAKMCTLFWYDGCKGKSRNIFSELATCTEMCEETNVMTRAEMCWDKFDMNYRNQCQAGNWQQRYYFDHASLTCRQFWYDGCRSNSRNMFDDALTCQWLCEAQPMYKSKSCLEDFDHRYKGMCNGGKWRQQWYFDKNSKKCVPFWFDGCQGSTKNFFSDELSCLKTCEDPASKDRIGSAVSPRGPSPPRKSSTPQGRNHQQQTHNHQRRTTISRMRVNTAEPTMRTISAMQPWHSNDKHRMREKLGDVFRPNMTNVCEKANPCQNNGTCHFSATKNTYYCYCRSGWRGSHCTEVIDRDPCELQPCKNGGTCKAKFENKKTLHECFCPTGFGGPSCSERPCDSSPCLNNGTCRTTAAASTFFCDCQHDFGGKNCEFAIGKPSITDENFGSEVEQVSSGKAEWVEEMKSRLSGAKKKPSSKENQADEQYKDPETKKRERAQREKEQEAENVKIREEEAKRKSDEAARIAEEEAKQQLEAELKMKNECIIPIKFAHFIPSIALIILFR
ncbi:hypothetical protein PENTCL1PPCAC_2015, partial [Pristionchus entomophagus]